MRIATLTSGGDCPGLNAVIRGVVRTASGAGATVVGYQDGWQGLLEDRRVQLYDDENIDRILRRGGTILGTGRLHPDDFRAGIDRVKANLADAGIDALIAIGGEGTLKGAQWLHENGVPVVGVPKTIDNDVNGTDATFGFDTAVAVATDAIDRLHTTAESHNRVMIVETMGRHVGWIALHAGMAGGAHDILIPEFPFDIEDVCKKMARRFQMGEKYGIIVVAEGAVPREGTLEMPERQVDRYGHEKLENMGQTIANEIHRRLDTDVRATVLGHIQRGGTPTAYDRVLATRFAVHATRSALRGEFGVVVALHGEEIQRISFPEAVGTLKRVPEGRYTTAQALFG
ncbi:ATP-dependent 6-phosphofructokinase [Corynebacterium bovis]|uniref:ATP-dependent 6-phosphofructokinase n=2 Tax=Corynebacterium bovis TaxID=36808 RepID=A0A3R8PJA5_9CORY|nr:ATP-dependent 6-phosphofructokinase [Corynebacterium bovis]MBB3116333.1 6-phosphofructokinase 1 [Corynebacterium bovis DSM 20582 = CIP 54.80]MDH2455258.1 ATP-dependent 6-phosphofructokinase [Corynebacterium bovis]MDK8510729.1 ATP-dependent 6-phosphofructokinase [Corynebacterium bovis]MDN8578803.1 ATP-dependent 6-phosphofructokinase [Corynebacterium bovis]QQC47571.1 6-phosphofructokinase [Corynebacterium bovis]